MRHRQLRSVLLAAMVSVAAPARAAVPSPSASTVDPCVRVCPSGDMTFHILVRDFAGTRIAGALVEIDFCQCPGVVFCPLTGSESYTIVAGCSVRMVSDANGLADFPIRAGGTCNGGQITVRADGVVLALRYAVSSPDQNGDATVSAADQGILATKLGGAYDPTGDLNCSAALEAGDPAILSAHLGHSCALAVPVRPGTWGRIKTLYR